ncbi:MAG TPA: N-methyl-L-tryptophan oxidase [Pseudacidobacterium sp.]|jgi:sarcosine oxidase|nr:N-methyl-L-tryptophan oxidase [Pseudacidobacterium sp.]
MTERYDVIVIGLGGVGSAAACHLAVRGKRVLGLERFTPGHDRGSSHGNSRIIRQAYHENPEYVPLVLRAYELWERLERDSGSELLCITGGLFVGHENSGVIRGSVFSAKKHGLAYECLDAAEVRRRFPVFQPRPDDYAVFEAKAGFLRPEVAVKAHLQIAVQHGATLHFEEPISDWRGTASGTVRIVTEKGAYESSHLVLAPGAWAPELLRSLVLPLHVRRHVMAWFDPVADRDLFLPERFPIYIWDTHSGVVFYGFPATDGVNGGVKAAIHSGGDVCTADSIELGISESDIAEIREQLVEYLPELNGRLLHAATCMYTMTPDENFVVAQHPEYSGVTIACGFSGHGFKFTSVLGEILADLAIDGSTGYPIEFLSPKRFFQG